MNDAPTISWGRTPCAILCADVHGYSRLMARDEEGTHERVSRSFRLIRALVNDYGGWIASTAGDSLVALFESASEALHFALAIQRASRDGAVRDDDDEPITFRIGIALGKVFFDEGNVQGHSVNVAARIQALARPGGICITDVVQRAASDSVDGRVRPLGLKYLKNIDEPVEVFAIDIDVAETGGPAIARPLSGPPIPSRPTVVVEALGAPCGIQDEIILALAMSESLTQALSNFGWLAVKEELRSGLVVPEPDGTAKVHDDHVVYVVTGNIIRVQSRLRLVVRLRERPGGRIIWCSGFDLRAGHTFKRLDELAAIIAARVDRQILVAEVSKAWQKPLDALSAHEHVTRAIPLIFQMSKTSLQTAERLLRAADEEQPRSSRNRTMRAFAALIRIGQQWADDPFSAVEYIDWLTRSAIEYSPDDALALSLRGHVESFIFHRFDCAIDCFDRAIRGNPSEPLSWAFSAVTLSYLGKTKEAARRLRRYRQLCPLDTYPFYFNTAFTLKLRSCGRVPQGSGDGTPRAG